VSDCELIGPSAALGVANDIETTASSIVACWTVFTVPLPGNTLIKSVTIFTADVCCGSYPYNKKFKGHSFFGQFSFQMLITSACLEVYNFALLFYFGILFWKWFFLYQLINLFLLFFASTI
jgi:hypothetical protein